ncbi:MAG TPA: LpxI family protein [Candidatus Omnitrophica bacterium]|nr:LpxI family protein [Candidatus Omnitrophota bacterium]
MNKIGLIAGSGRFPILFATQAKKRGVDVVAIAVRGDTSPKLKGRVDKFFWLKISQFNKISAIFKKEGISQAVMAGQINPRRLFSKSSNFGPELESLLKNIKDKKADTIFGAIADKLKSEGVELISSLSFLSDYLPGKGVLTKKKPSEEEEKDIVFGLDMAKKIAGLDIGQTIVVKERAVLAVEALEGTNITIRRGGIIGREGAIVIKVSKPQQDIRFDVPVVGITTIKNLIKAGISCLAIEAGKTLLLDREKCIKLADKKGIIITTV